MQGKTAEARQLLLQAMPVADLSQPNSEAWLGFDLIDEQYGVTSAAIAAHRRVRPADGPGNPITPFTWRSFD